MQKDRDLQFDIVRVLATLWIVGVWHVLDYLGLPNVQEVRSEYDLIALMK